MEALKKALCPATYIECRTGEAGAPLSRRYDSYEGVINVDPRSLPSDGATFKKSLMASVAQWRRERKHGICLKLPIANVNLVEAAVAAGFGYHHAEPAYPMLTLWLPDGPCSLSPNASYQVGVGAFVLNDKNEILAVQEKNGPLKGTGVWKMPTDVTNQKKSEMKTVVQTYNFGIALVTQQYNIEIVLPQDSLQLTANLDLFNKYKILEFTATIDVFGGFTDTDRAAK